MGNNLADEKDFPPTIRELNDDPELRAMLYAEMLQNLIESIDRCEWSELDELIQDIHRVRMMLPEYWGLN